MNRARVFESHSGTSDLIGLDAARCDYRIRRPRRSAFCIVDEGVRGQLYSSTLIASVASGNTAIERLEVDKVWSTVCGTPFVTVDTAMEVTAAIAQRVETTAFGLYCPVPVTSSDSPIAVRYTEILSAWREFLAEHHIEELARQVGFVFEDWDAEEAPIPAEQSFRALLAFMALHMSLKTPYLACNPAGHFIAVWQSAGKLRLSLEFFGKDQTRWIYVDSRKGIQSATTGTGLANGKLLEEILRTYKVYEWMRL